jgi:hypothetical protein
MPRNVLLMGVRTQESRQWWITTVWIVDRAEDAPRIVTAYPDEDRPFEMINEHDRIVLTELGSALRPASRSSRIVGSS